MTGWLKCSTVPPRMRYHYDTMIEVWAVLITMTGWLKFGAVHPGMRCHNDKVPVISRQTLYTRSTEIPLLCLIWMSFPPSCQIIYPYTTHFTSLYHALVMLKLSMTCQSVISWQNTHSVMNKDIQLKQWKWLLSQLLLHIFWLAYFTIRIM